MSTKVVTGEVRFSYAHVFEPHAVEDGKDLKYSVSILIPKTDKKTLDAIDAAVKQAIEEGKSKWGGKIPPASKLKLPLRDGDTEKDDEAYAGMMFLNANANKKPGVVDANIAPILNREEFYSGCWGRASINFYAFSNSGNNGIGVGLNHVQKLRDGDNLGGAMSTPDEDFGTDDDLM